MGDLFEFLSLSDPNIRYVVLGVVLLSSSSAVVGSFTLLKKKALVGDAVAHSVLPGVCLAFLLAGNKNPLFLVPGAFITGWISLLLIDVIVSKSKIKEDTAIGLILSVFFGIGILLLTYIQHSGNANQSGLDHFLFGKAAALVGSDLMIFGIVAAILIVVVVLFFKELTLLAFNEDFAQSMGIPVRAIELILTTLTVLAVVVGIQAVGVVLMAAMLITPGAAARYWTDDLRKMLVLAATFGAVSGVVGAYISYSAPGMPTGPWIVMVVSLIAMASFFFAPGKGILYRMISQRRIRNRMEEENVLKALFLVSEENGPSPGGISEERVIERRYFEKPHLTSLLGRLRRDGYIEKSTTGWKLTTPGTNKGRRIVKLHRLWEVYLTKYVNIAPDHVHEDAESIEHVLTPDLEERLEKLLDYPETDPHESKIPY